MDLLGVVSFKGGFSITFVNRKEAFNADKAMSFLAGLRKMYPEKIMFSYQKQRGSEQDTRRISSTDEISEILSNMITGCIDVHGLRLSCSSVMDPLWGTSWKYGMTFGTESVDVGHVSYLASLPDIPDGCYRVTANFHGKLGKRKTREYYRTAIDLEICILKKDMKDYMHLIDQGYKVYPMKLKYPELYPGDTTSESEAQSEEEEPVSQDLGLVRKRTQEESSAHITSGSSSKKKRGSKTATLLRMMKTRNVYPLHLSSRQGTMSTDPIQEDEVEEEPHRAENKE